MKTKKTLLLLILLFWAVLPAQRVGINTSDPKATLEIKSSDLQNPSPTDGFLVPKVEKLNLNLTADQDGMILFLITDWVDTSVTPNIVYSAGLYTFDWNYTTQSGNWLKLLASKATTKPITVFRSLSSGKIAIGDVGGGRSNGTDFTSLPGNDNILKATLVKTVSQTEYFKIHMTTPLESSAYLTIVTLESRGIEGDLSSNNSTILNDSNCFVPGTADFKNGSFIVGVKCSGGTNNLVLNILVFDLYKGE